MDLVGASLLATCIGLIIYKIFVQDDSKYWTKIGANYVKPKIPYLSEMYDLFMIPIDQLVLKQRKKNGIIYGVNRMGKRRLVVNDPEIIRQICIRDFDYFPNREVGTWTNDYNRNSLVWTQDEHWKRVRTMMSPTFTSGKIKRMFKLMDECANDLVENLREQCVRAIEQDKLDNCQVDLVKTFEMYTMDGIATCCYGIKLKRDQEEAQTKANNDNNSKLQQQQQDLNYASRELFAEYAGKMLTFSRLRALIVMIMPEFILHLIGFKIIPDSELKPLADRVQKMIDMRRKQLPNKQTKYDDLLQLLVDAKFDDKLELNDLDQKENHHASLTHESLIEDQNKLKASVVAAASNTQQVVPSSKTKLSDMEILCEAMLLLAAGLDTTRASLSSITYFLAHNLDIQERLYKELQAIAQYAPTSEGKKVVTFNYDSLTACEYLDAVISEGLRRFTPVVSMSREAKKDYFIEKYKIFVPKGMCVFMGIYAIHMDPNYWPEPEKFDPNRFMPGRREKIIPGTYLPFTMGPRHCIGMRFSLTETKLGLAKALMNFRFLPAPGTKYPPVAKQALGIMTIKDCRTIIVPRENCE